MLVKIILVFLGAMVLVAMVGNLLFPGAFGRGMRRSKPLNRLASCPDCGRYLFGKSGCDCRKRG